MFSYKISGGLNQLMTFYRKLGPITFQEQSESFQIFTAEPLICIFQPKSTPERTAVFSELERIYKQILHDSSIKVYMQPPKISSFVIYNCRKLTPEEIGALHIGDFIRQACVVIQRVKDRSEGYGEVSSQFFRMINGQLRFFYLPTCLKKEGSLSEVDSIIEFAQNFKEHVDSSEKLLLKKLKKCKTLHDIMEEISYFNEIYKFKHHKQTMSLKMPVKINTSQKRIVYLKKQHKSKKQSKHKFEPRLFQSYHSKTSSSLYNPSERRSSHALHISLTKSTSKLKTTSNYTASSFRGRSSAERPYHQIGQSHTNSQLFRDSLNNFNDRELDKPKHQYKNGGSKISSNDEERLLNNIKNKLKKTKFNQASHQHLDKQAEQIKDNNHNENHTIQKERNAQVEIDHISQMPNQKINQKPFVQIVTKHVEISKEIAYKPQEHIKKSIVQPKSQVESVLANSNCKLVSPPEKQYYVLDRAFVQQDKLSKKQMIELIDRKKSQKSSVNTQQTFKQKGIKQQIGVKSKKSLPKSVPKQKSQNFNYIKQSSEIQVIDLSKVANKQSKDKELKVGKQSTKQSLQKVVINKQIQIEQAYLKRLSQIDLMGATVANTKNYLKQFKDILWELPMFFLYKNFYLQRKEVEKALLESNKNSNLSKKMVEQNVNIAKAIQNLIKILKKKLKADDPEFLTSIKGHLDLNGEDKLQQITLQFLVEYIKSLRDALQQKLFQLEPHLVQVIDSLLVFKGHLVNIEERQMIFEKKSYKDYLQRQFLLAKPYYDSYAEKE